MPKPGLHQLLQFLKFPWDWGYFNGCWMVASIKQTDWHLWSRDWNSTPLPWNYISYISSTQCALYCVGSILTPQLNDCAFQRHRHGVATWEAGGCNHRFPFYKFASIPDRKVNIYRRHHRKHQTDAVQQNMERPKGLLLKFQSRFTQIYLRAARTSARPRGTIEAALFKEGE